MEVEMASGMTIFCYKQGVFHFYVSSRDDNHSLVKRSGLLLVLNHKPFWSDSMDFQKYTFIEHGNGGK